MSDKIILLDSVDELKKVNPWHVDIARELEIILKVLKEKINFIIAGIAAENSSILYLEKISKIFSLTEEKRRMTSFKKLSHLVKPEISIAAVPEHSLIDISNILPILYDLLERKISKANTLEERTEIPIFEDYTRKIIRLKEEIGTVIKKFLKLYGEPISISDIFETLSNHHFAVIFLIILFMYMDGEIDFQIVEGEDIYDVRVKLPG